MNRTKVYGLILSMLTDDVLDSPVRVANFSMLYGEITKSSNKLYTAFSEVKEVQNAELVGDINSAKQALGNANSPDLSDIEKTEQMERAWGKFEDAYYALTHIPHMLQMKAEVAEHIAVCFAMMQDETMTRWWLKRAVDDHNSFCIVPEMELTKAERFSEAAQPVMKTTVSKTNRPVSGAGLLVLASGLTFGAAGLIVGGVVAVGVLANGIKSDKTVTVKRDANENLRRLKDESRRAVAQIEGAIAKM